MRLLDSRCAHQLPSGDRVQLHMSDDQSSRGYLTDLRIRCRIDRRRRYNRDYSMGQNEWPEINRGSESWAQAPCVSFFQGNMAQPDSHKPILHGKLGKSCSPPRKTKCSQAIPMIVSAVQAPPSRLLHD